MATGDGNGWVQCRCGDKHWGRLGAAGLLLVRPGPDDATQVLLQLRAAWTHQGGAWGVPGGARDSHESVQDAALREAHEEAGIEPGRVGPVDGSPRIGVDHGDWSYVYVLAQAPAGLPAGPPNAESEELAWVDLDQVAGLPLHSGLARAWPDLHAWVRASLSR